MVDDDPSALHDLEAKVRSADVEVVGTTNDGEHALELARLLRPDLALIDWNMRRFGGALTARLMRRYAPDVCPVLLIEHADLEEVQTKDAEITFCTVMKHSDGTDLSDALRAARRHAATRERPN